MDRDALKQVMTTLQTLQRAGRHEEVAALVKKCLASGPDKPLFRLHFGAPLIDCGSDLQRRDLTEIGLEVLEESLHFLKAEEDGALSPSLEAQIRYNLSNGYADLARRANEVGEADVADKASDKRREHLHFAALVSVVRNDYVSEDVFARILVNYAILLNENGRIAEAIDFCTDCLRKIPNHPMALGTLGSAFMRFAQYDPRYRPFHLALAWRYLSDALAEPARLYEVAGVKEEEYFNFRLEWVAKQIRRLISEGDETVQQWVERVLTNHEVTPVPEWVAQWADDRLLLSFGPGLVSCSRHFADDAFIPEPRFPARENTSRDDVVFFLDTVNQMKEEFATARHLYYLAVGAGGGLEDRDRRIDYAFGYESRVFGLRTGLLKASFRQAHDILEKVAVCINLYFDLPRLPTKVSFSNVLREPSDGRRILQPVKDRLESNVMLAGLSDLISDWYSGRFPGPLKNHRNAATHRNLPLGPEMVHGEVEGGALDSVEQFRRRTYLLLRMVRAAVLYFMGSVVHVENVEWRGDDGSFPIVEFEVGVMVPRRNV